MAYNKYRVSRDVYEREDESAKILPAKIIYLSVEGNVTEKEYFECLTRCRRRLGINSKITVEVLHRKDTNSAPKHVVELLEEYVELRNTNEEIETSDLPQLFRQNHSSEEVKDYLEGRMDQDHSKAFSEELRLLGFDISYIKYLKTYENEYDEFGIVIDRDKNTHSEKNMLDCIGHCREKKYLCYISNPCFEFWLLLHLCDVKIELADHLEDINENVKVSRHHTFVSNEVSKRANHGKGNLNFEANYLDKISSAVERAKGFPDSEEELVNNIGTNIWKLVEKLKNYTEVSPHS
jgi:hypothetical protein